MIPVSAYFASANIRTMEANYGLLSLLPPLLAVVLSILSRQVFISLLLGIWAGWLIIANGNLLQGSLQTVQALVDVFADAGNTRTIMFCALVGGLIIMMQRSGGVEGFIRLIQQWLSRQAEAGEEQSRRRVAVMAWLTGMLIFVESSISVLTVGALYRPLFDKLKMSREELAYIADSTSANSSILIPFNGWGAFIMGLLVVQGFADPFSVMMSAMVWNFYPMLALLLCLVMAWRGWLIGSLQLARRRTEEGKVLWENARPMVGAELTDQPMAAGVVPRAFNMVVPIVLMVVLMPLMLAYTGWEIALKDQPQGGWLNTFVLAIGKGSGSTAVLIAVLTSLLMSMLLYKLQRIMGFVEMVELSLKGISGMMPLALLMMLAFAIGSLCKQLGTGLYVAELTRAWLSPSLTPLLIFVVSCFIAFATGTSWGTFAIMIPIAVPMAQQLGADVTIAIAAALGGGVFGDHCSPISDTTILSSMASATDHVDHVKTQLPYALLAGAGAAFFYLILGIW